MGGCTAPTNSADKLTPIALASQIGILPYAGVDIATFELLKEHMLDVYDGSPPPYCILGAGMLSSTVAQFVSYPLALTRTRLQASQEPTIHPESVSLVLACESLLCIYLLCMYTYKTSAVLGSICASFCPLLPVQLAAQKELLFKIQLILSPQRRVVHLLFDDVFVLLTRM